MAGCASHGRWSTAAARYFVRGNVNKVRIISLKHTGNIYLCTVARDPPAALVKKGSFPLPFSLRDTLRPFRPLPFVHLLLAASSASPRPLASCRRLPRRRAAATASASNRGPIRGAKLLALCTDKLESSAVYDRFIRPVDRRGTVNGTRRRVSFGDSLFRLVRFIADGITLLK